MKVLEALSNGENYLRDHNIEDSNLDSKYLLSNTLHVNRAGLICMYQDEISDKSYKAFMRDIRKRSRHIPLDYIIGTKKFYKLDFNVNKNVLIPRDDTEVLVIESLHEFDKYINESKVLKNNDEMSDKNKSFYNIIDMCTGSGCIALSLAYELPYANIYGVDLSRGALKVARSNKVKNNISNVSFIRSNLFKKFKDERFSESVDMIVSNPPYIKTDICKTLDKEVKDHEPMMALCGGKDGLIFYKKIINEAKRLLVNHGILAFEIDYTYYEAIKSLLEDAKFSDIKLFKDMSGNDRVIIARLHRY